MTDSYRMSDMCAMCGERYGQHVGLSCCNSRGSFFLPAKPANGPESYHYRASIDDYFTRAAQQANRLDFPSGAAVLTSGVKIVGRVEAEPEPLTDLIKRVFGHPTPTQHYAVDPNAHMKVRDAGLFPSRAPLPHFNQRTEFDPFPDYVVFHEFEPVAPLHTSPTTDSAYPAIAGLLRG